MTASDCFCVSKSFEGQVLDLNTHIISLGKWPRSSLAVRRALFVVFSLVFCPIAGLQRSKCIEKLQIVGTASFLSTSRRGLSEGPNKLPTARFCSKLSSVKCSAQTRECFEGVMYSLFIFISHRCSFQFWVLGELELTLDFECLCGFPLKFTVNLKTKQFQISRVS